jgi:hypothetical protein
MVENESTVCEECGIKYYSRYKGKEYPCPNRCELWKERNEFQVNRMIPALDVMTKWNMTDVNFIEYVVEHYPPLFFEWEDGIALPWKKGLMPWRKDEWAPCNVSRNPKCKAELLKLLRSGELFFYRNNIEDFEEEHPELSKQPTERAMNYFCKGTDFWKVGFQGESDHVKATKGMNYIAYLLSNAGKKINVLTITGSLDSVPLNNETAYEEMDDTGLEDEGMHSVASKTTDIGLSRNMRRKALERLQDLEEAKKSGTPEEIDKAQRIFDEYTAYAKKVKKEDALDPGRDKERKRILNAIERARKNLKKKCPMLFAYLDEYIHTGSTCSYVPDKDNPIDWHIES